MRGFFWSLPFLVVISLGVPGCGGADDAEAPPAPVTATDVPAAPAPPEALAEDVGETSDPEPEPAADEAEEAPAPEKVPAEPADEIETAAPDACEPCNEALARFVDAIEIGMSLDALADAFVAGAHTDLVLGLFVPDPDAFAAIAPLSSVLVCPSEPSHGAVVMADENPFASWILFIIAEEDKVTAFEVQGLPSELHEPRPGARHAGGKPPAWEAWKAGLEMCD